MALSAACQQQCSGLDAPADDAWIKVPCSGTTAAINAQAIKCSWGRHQPSRLNAPAVPPAYAAMPGAYPPGAMQHMYAAAGAAPPQLPVAGIPVGGQPGMYAGQLAQGAPTYPHQITYPVRPALHNAAISQRPPLSYHCHIKGFSRVSQGCPLRLCRPAWTIVWHQQWPMGRRMLSTPMQPRSRHCRRSKRRRRRACLRRPTRRWVPSTTATCSSPRHR
jgi:hypothetical protein